FTANWGQNKNMIVFLPNGGGTDYNVNGNQYDNSSFNQFYATKSTTFGWFTTNNPWFDIKLSTANNPNLNAETLQLTNALFTFGSNSGIQGNQTGFNKTF